MRERDVLDLERRDDLAAAVDDLLRAAGEVEPAVVVEAPVASQPSRSIAGANSASGARASGTYPRMTSGPRIRTSPVLASTRSSGPIEGPTDPGFSSAYPSGVEPTGMHSVIELVGITHVLSVARSCAATATGSAAAPLRTSRSWCRGASRATARMAWKCEGTA